MEGMTDGRPVDHIKKKTFIGYGPIVKKKRSKDPFLPYKAYVSKFIKLF